MLFVWRHNQQTRRSAACQTGCISTVQLLAYHLRPLMPRVLLTTSVTADGTRTGRSTLLTAKAQHAGGVLTSTIPKCRSVNPPKWRQTPGQKDQNAVYAAHRQALLGAQPFRMLRTSFKCCCLRFPLRARRQTCFQSKRNDHFLAASEIDKRLPRCPGLHARCGILCTLWRKITTARRWCWQILPGPLVLPSCLATWHLQAVSSSTLQSSSCTRISALTALRRCACQHHNFLSQNVFFGCRRRWQRHLSQARPCTARWHHALRALGCRRGAQICPLLWRR